MPVDEYSRLIPIIDFFAGALESVFTPYEIGLPHLIHQRPAAAPRVLRGPRVSPGPRPRHRDRQLVEPALRARGPHPTRLPRGRRAARGGRRRARPPRPRNSAPPPRTELDDESHPQRGLRRGKTRAPL